MSQNIGDVDCHLTKNALSHLYNIVFSTINIFLAMCVFAITYEDYRLKPDTPVSQLQHSSNSLSSLSIRAT